MCHSEVRVIVFPRRSSVEPEMCVGRQLPAPWRIDVSTMDSSATAKAATLLENLRRTPMTRGHLREGTRIVQANIARTIEHRGVPERLAVRIASQLVLKFQV